MSRSDSERPDQSDAARVRRRLALYGLAAAVVGGLAFGGFFWKPAPDVGTLVNGAEFQIRFGLFEKGLDQTRQALARDPDHGYANLLAATAYEGLERWDEALKHYVIAEKAYDSDRRQTIRAAVVACLSKAGRHSQVEARAAEHLASHPEDTNVLMTLGASREARGEFEQALEAYGAAFETGKQRSRTAFACAFALAHLDRSDEAVQRLEDGLEESGDAVGAWILLARLRLKLGRQDDAVDALRRSAALDEMKAREEVRQHRAWIPLRDRTVVASLFEARRSSEGIR